MENFLLETNPSFVLLRLENGDFVFYNSIRHIGCRLHPIELRILDLAYTYQDYDYILSKFSGKQKVLIEKSLDFIKKEKLLSVDPIKEKTTSAKPSVFYFHLTYRCNLKCEYCYNKNIRNNNYNEMSVDKWKLIIDKIAPYAKQIILTGGEFMLYKGCVDVVKYIKSRIPDIRLSCISNGMHDFEKEHLLELFDYIDAMSFSCDSIEREGLRRGFNADLFVSNVRRIRECFPNIEMTISSVLTKANEKDIEITEDFCNKYRCSFDRNLLIPEQVSDIESMPSLEQQKRLVKVKGEIEDVKKLNAARFRCGAGRTTCSIGPMGNVYPCQSLHFNEFLMGNLLNENIEQLKYINDSTCVVPSVDKISVCSSCNVRYICGGGCLATGYNLNHTLGRNHLTCHLNRMNALKMLRRLNNRYE